MSNSKFLSDSAWKDMLSRNKGVKDNGLLKVLADYKRLADDRHDDALEFLEQILKLAAQQKKAKDAAAVSSVVKYLTDLIDAAESDRRAITRAKADADKARDARSEADKKAKAEAKNDDDEEDEDEASTLLTTKMVPLLRQVNKGQRMHALVASTGKQVAVMLSRKPIAPARRKVLAEALGATGGVKYFVGHCELEEGMTTFALKTQAAGMAKKIKLALLQQTGLRVNKLRCRGEDGDTDDDEDEGDDALAGRPDDGETAEQPGAKVDPLTGMASEQAPPPAPAPAQARAPETSPTPQQIEVLNDRRREFKKARAAWVAVKARAEEDLEKVKDGAHMAYLADGDQFPKVVAGCKAIDAILDNLDDALRDTLDQYASTPLRNQTKLHTLAATAVGVLERYQNYVAGNAMMRAIDEKEFADVTVHAPVMKALGDLRKALA